MKNQRLNIRPAPGKAVAFMLCLLVAASMAGWSLAEPPPALTNGPALDVGEGSGIETVDEEYLVPAMYDSDETGMSTEDLLFIRKCTTSMAITDLRYSARSDVRGPEVFDDIGCALKYRDSLEALQQMRFDTVATVVDYFSGQRVAMKDAYYFVDPSIVNTPMGYGIAAFANAAGAIAFLNTTGAGAIVTYYQLADLPPSTLPGAE